MQLNILVEVATFWRPMKSFSHECDYPRSGSVHGGCASAKWGDLLFGPGTWRRDDALPLLSAAVVFFAKRSSGFLFHTWDFSLLHPVEDGLKTPLGTQNRSASSMYKGV